MLALGLDAAQTVPPAALPGPPARDPDSIGPYRILGKLGEGGMGTVYLAEQAAPVSRKVALKVVKHGIGTSAVIRRFDAERQALALMDHPSIARVYEAGETGDGLPYFAMEYVQGEPITDHCDRERLTTRERLELLVEVCLAVQHAHRKGVIHRDIKPSNVLVTRVDGKSVPKIIDFGIARAVEQRLTERSLFTELGMIVGTPEYMSPEQAEFTGERVDTRTDVYSLGVLQYELMTGALPFDPAELRAGGFEQICRRIREEEPSRPSARVSGAGEVAARSATLRGVDVATLRRQLTGDLDWVAMKAL
ncbi:MAG TPA: serine/threonine-protein kinase, partial [Candidatus Saccharimonadales bacterium]|nr:serine/threonine-protein kinase [Candidatus Saccharimonadales bacterium]